MSSAPHDQKLKELCEQDAHILGHLLFATALGAQHGSSTSQALRVPRALAAVIRTVLQDNYPACPRPMREDVIRGAAYAASLHATLHASEDNELAQEMGRAHELLRRVPWAYIEHVPELLVFDGLEGVPQEHSFFMRLVPHGEPVIDESLGRITLCPKHLMRLVADLRAAYPLASLSIQA